MTGDPPHGELYPSRRQQLEHLQDGRPAAWINVAMEEIYTENLHDGGPAAWQPGASKG